MPATSKAQQRLFAVALHHPSALSRRHRNLADLSSMTLRHFAETPRKSLPKKVKKRG